MADFIAKVLFFPMRRHLLLHRHLGPHSNAYCWLPLCMTPSVRHLVYSRSTIATNAHRWIPWKKASRPVQPLSVLISLWAFGWRHRAHAQTGSSCDCLDTSESTGRNCRPTQSQQTTELRSPCGHATGRKCRTSRPHLWMFQTRPTICFLLNLNFRESRKGSQTAGCVPNRWTMWSVWPMNRGHKASTWMPKLTISTKRRHVSTKDVEELHRTKCTSIEYDGFWPT